MASAFDRSFSRAFEATFPRALELGQERRAEERQEEALRNLNSYGMEMAGAVDQVVYESLLSEKGGRLELGMFNQQVEDLAGLEGPVRAGAVERIKEQWQQKHNEPLAPAVVDFLKKAKPEDLQGYATTKAQTFALNPDMTIDDARPSLTDERAAIQDIGSTMKSVRAQHETETPITSEFDLTTASQREAKHSFELAERNIKLYVQGFQGVMAKANASGHSLPDSVKEAFTQRIDRWVRVREAALERQQEIAGIGTAAETAAASEMARTRAAFENRGLSAATAATQEAATTRARLGTEAQMGEVVEEGKARGDLARLDTLTSGLQQRGVDFQPRELAEGAGLLPGRDSRDQKIADLVGQEGRDGKPITREQAAKIVDNNYRIEVVPQTGAVRLIDEVRGTVEEIAIDAPQDRDFTREMVKSKETLWSQADDATGLWSAAKEAWSRTFGQIPGVPIATDTITARTAFELAMGEMRRAMSINPRFPVGEMERLEEEVDIQPSIFDSPAALKARMRRIDDSVRRRLQQAERDSKDTSLPQDTRSSQAANASALRNFLDIMGVPAESGDAPEGFPGTQKDWQFLTDEERKLWQ